MLAVVSFPRGLETALLGAVTLSQTLLIQSGRALEAEFQVKSSFQEFYSCICSFVSHRNRPHPGLWGEALDVARAFSRAVTGCRHSLLCRIAAPSATLLLRSERRPDSPGEFLIGWFAVLRREGQATAQQRFAVGILGCGNENGGRVRPDGPSDRCAGRVSRGAGGITVNSTRDFLAPWTDSVCSLGSCMHHQLLCGGNDLCHKKTRESKGKGRQAKAPYNGIRDSTFLYERDLLELSTSSAGEPVSEEGEWKWYRTYVEVAPR
jgi:hypothetical protein